ncbi:MAG TPA: ABC transporter permease [Vicinamibacterales bacterium]
MFRPLRAWVVRLFASVRGTPGDHALADELASHLQLHIDDNLRAGMSPEEARRQALLKLGGIAQTKEAHRDRRGLPWVDDVLRDLRHAGRLLRRSPGVALVAVLTLGLGIGATTAVFSAFNGHLLQTVPVAHPETLVRFRWVGANDMGTDFTDYGFSGQISGQRTRATFSYPMYEVFRAHNHTLADIVACAPWDGLVVVTGGGAELATGFVASGNYFQVLGVSAEAGRTFGPADDRPAAPPVAVISDGFWRRRFGGNSSVIGATLDVSGVPVTIVGVTPSRFTGIQSASRQAPDLILPLALAARLEEANGFNIASDTNRSVLEDATAWWVQVVGRLKPGMTAAQVRGDLEGAFQAAAREGWKSFYASMPAAKQSALAYRDRTRVPALNVTSAAHGIYDVPADTYRTLSLLGVVVVLILLIVCANLANLLLARATARRGEMAVRLAMGATRGRLMRQLLAESLLLGTLGGAAGLVIACWGRLLLPGTDGSAPLDGHVLAFAAAVSLLTAVIFGCAPAVRAARGEVPARDDRRTVSGRTRLASGFVIAQVTISTVLLVGAGLFLTTVGNLSKVDVGFNPDSLLLISVNPRLNGYDRARTVSLYDQILEAFGHVPGVRAATLSDYPILSGGTHSMSLFIEGRPAPERRAEQDIDLMVVAPDFFETMGIPLRAGRQFTGADREGGPNVVIINQAAAREYFPHEDPIGQHLGSTYETRNQWEVVGVVGDVKYNTVRTPAPPILYVPYRQHMTQSARPAIFELRTAGDPLAIVPAVRAAVQRIDARLPILSVSTQEQEIEDRFAEERLFAEAYTAFGVLALLIASIGLFGLMSYGVARRTKEIGIRVALGAVREDVIRMVLGESLVLVALGIAVGVVVVLAAGRLVATLLFGVAPTDAVTMSLAITLMVIVAGIAGYLPARRAARIDPMEALREN